MSAISNGTRVRTDNTSTINDPASIASSPPANVSSAHDKKSTRLLPVSHVRKIFSNLARRVLDVRLKYQDRTIAARNITIVKMARNHPMLLPQVLILQRLNRAETGYWDHKCSEVDTDRMADRICHREHQEMSAPLW